MRISQDVSRPGVFLSKERPDRNMYLSSSHSNSLLHHGDRFLAEVNLGWNEGEVLIVVPE